MPFALLLTSHVAASRVGGGVSERVLEANGVDTALLPTVLYGRHPGWGAPGGGAVDDEILRSMIAAIDAQGLFSLTDLVLTGYFASVDQVRIAAETIDAVREAPRSPQAARRETLIAVDPILGDAPGGLYVPKPVAIAMRDALVARADLVTPNAFELGWLTGRTIPDLPSAVRAARSLGRPALVSSLPCGANIGVLYVDETEAWLVEHKRAGKAPNGTGDALAAAFLAARINGAEPRAALEYAVSLTAIAVQKAAEWSAPELPLVALRDRLRDPQPRLSAAPV